MINILGIMLVGAITIGSIIGTYLGLRNLYVRYKLWRYDVWYNKTNTEINKPKWKNKYEEEETKKLLKLEFDKRLFISLLFLFCSFIIGSFVLLCLGVIK